MSLAGRLRLPAPCIRQFRRISTTACRRQTPTPIPYTATCPSPTCACASTPPDLDIDRKSPLLNTVASYSEQVVICTGKEDWSSRIEDEQTPSGDFVRGLKGVIGRGGKGFDPFNNVLVTASSFPASQQRNATNVMLFPSFRRILSIPHSPTALEGFATAYLKARDLHPMHASLSTEQQAHLRRDESLAEILPPAEPITRPTIFICGHGGRDKRCGILGPILKSSFEQELRRKEIEADVGLISHIGGHKYAGNVVMYIPPNVEGHALKGAGIWYGRVGPENVEGVVEETVVKGRVITEMLRGGITRDGENLGRIIEAQIKKEMGEDEGALKLKPRAR